MTFGFSKSPFFNPFLKNLLIQFDNFLLFFQCKLFQGNFCSFYGKCNAANHFYIQEEKITFYFSLQQFSSFNFKPLFKMFKCARFSCISSENCTIPGNHTIQSDFEFVLYRGLYQVKLYEEGTPCISIFVFLRFCNKKPNLCSVFCVFCFLACFSFVS